MFCLNKNPSINVQNCTIIRGFDMIKTHLIQHIFLYHQPKNLKDYIDLRCLSTRFHMALLPPPLWVSYPNPAHVTLQSLIDRLEELRGNEENSSNVPSVLFIEEGEHRDIALRDGTQTHHITIQKPITIIGAGCRKTTLFGFGMEIRGKKSEGIVEIHDLKIKGGDGTGLYAYNGMNVIMRGCTIEECGWNGVVALHVDITCDDLQVINCGCSGVCANWESTITLSGHGTTIQGNVTKGRSDDYGLDAYDSFIHLIHPLTKEKISTDNGGGRNWGEYGTIKQISK